MDSSLTPLAPRARWLFHLQALWRLAMMLPLLATATGVAIFFGAPWLPSVAGALAAGMLATIWALWIPALSFDRWGYTLSDDELLIQHGVLFRELTAIPTSRVQHVDTHQGPMEQLLGLARVHVYTASGMGADGVIPGLDPDVAQRLRDRLVQSGGDDGV